MPNRYYMHAMGIKKGLLHQKRHLVHFLSSHLGHSHHSHSHHGHSHHSPIKHLQIGAGAGHRRADSDSDQEGEGMYKKHRPRKLKPISFKF